MTGRRAERLLRFAKQYAVELAIGVGLLAWCTYVWVMHTRLVREFTFDDAFITLRYARNLVTHGVLSFNVDDRIDGYTSPGWTVVLGAALAVGTDGEVAMHVLGWVSGLAAALLAAVFARRLGASLTAAVGIGAIGTVSTPGFVIWSVSGMETPYVAALATALVASYCLAPTRRVSWVNAVLALLCATARPECLVLVAVLFVGDVQRACFNPPLERAARGVAHRLRPQLAVAAILLLLFALHWAYYGHPLPNTYYAKRPTAGLSEHGYREAFDFLNQGVVLFAALIALGRLASAPARHRWVTAAFVAWTTATIVVYARAGGDFVGFHRYYQPLIPVSYGILASTIPRLITAQRGIRAQVWVGVVALSFALLLPKMNRGVLARAIRDDIGELGRVTAFAKEWRDVGHALRARFSSDTSIAVRPAGIIPWITGFKTFDVLALNNPEIAHGNAPSRDIPGHQLEATIPQVIEWRPDVVVWHPYVIPENLTGRPPGGAHAPKNHPFVAAGYEYECSPMPSNATYICYWVTRAKSRLSGSEGPVHSR